MNDHVSRSDIAIRTTRRRRLTGRALKLGAWLSLFGAAQMVFPVAWSHHSFAMYDTKVTRTLTGRLTQFVPGANHAQLIFELLETDGSVRVDASGEPVLWGVETGPAAQIARRGVTLEHFAVGTVITVDLNPLRDGRNFGALARDGGQLIHCGTELPAGGCTPESGTVYLGDE